VIIVARAHDDEAISDGLAIHTGAYNSPAFSCVARARTAIVGNAGNRMAKIRSIKESSMSYYIRTTSNYYYYSLGMSGRHGLPTACLFLIGLPMFVKTLL
jgi:hypothetical protein